MRAPVGMLARAPAAEGVADCGPPPPRGSAEPLPLAPATEDALPSLPPTPVPAAPQQPSSSHAAAWRGAGDCQHCCPGCAKRGRRGGRGRGRGRHIAVTAPPKCRVAVRWPTCSLTPRIGRPAHSRRAFQAGLVSLDAVSLEDEVRKRVHTFQSVPAKLRGHRPCRSATRTPACCGACLPSKGTPGLETVHAGPAHAPASGAGPCTHCPRRA